jgi:hypothetical protein
MGRLPAEPPRRGGGTGTVEIREWLRSMGERVRLLVVIPLAAALIAALIGFIAPTKYKATTTVILPGVSQNAPLTSQTAQRVADFSAAVKSEGVLDAVSAELAIPRGDLDAVSVTRSGSSGVLAVAYTGTNPDEVGTIAEEVARQALRAQSQVNRDAADAAVQGAQKLFDAAEKTYQDATLEAGFEYSDELLVELSRRYNDAIDALNKATAGGDRTQIAETQAAVDQKAARLTAAQGLQSLYNARASASSLLDTAKARLADADGQLILAQTLTMPTTRALPQSKLRAVAQRVIFAAAFGFLSAVGLLILLQLLQVRSNPTLSAQEAPTLLPRRRAAPD